MLCRGRGCGQMSGESGRGIHIPDHRGVRLLPNPPPSYMCLGCTRQTWCGRGGSWCLMVRGYVAMSACGFASECAVIPRLASLCEPKSWFHSGGSRRSPKSYCSSDRTPPASMLRPSSALTNGWAGSRSCVPSQLSDDGGNWDAPISLSALDYPLPFPLTLAEKLTVGSWRFAVDGGRGFLRFATK
jgi:hypothetical protein